MVCLNDSIPFDYPKLGADGSPSSDYRDNVYVVTRMKFDRNGDGQCEPSFFLAFRRAINHGTTWDEAFILTDDSGRTAGDFQNIAVAANGDVYMAEGAYSRLVCPSGFGAALRKSTDGGATFSAPACAYDAAANSAVDRTWTATDPSDPSRIWIAFTAVSFQPVLQRHILVVRSSDSGVTWSAAVRVDDVLPDDVVDHWHPALSVGGNGRLDLAWFDYRNSTPKTVSGQPADIYYSWSTDGGLTWAPNVRLTPLAPAYNAPGNDYLGIASSGRRAYVAYAQDQDGIPNSEVHVATIEHTP
jgi:hypothetical protein